MATFTDRIKRVTDKFFKLSLEYYQGKENIGRFSNSENTIGYEIYTVNAFPVYEKLGDKANIDINSIGKVDLSEGYVYFHITDLIEVGLVVSGVLQMNPNRDYVVFKSERYELIGANFVGFDKDTSEFVLVRCNFRKEIQNG